MLKFVVSRDDILVSWSRHFGYPRDESFVKALTMANEAVHTVVRCTQCCHVFCKPKLLPCLHTFCEACILKLQEETEKDKVFSCPVTTCKEEVVKGNDDIPDNVLVANIINAKSVTCSKSKGVVKCTSCDNLLEASHRCLDCQRFLCVNCHAAHKHMQIFRRHRMQDIAEFLRTQQAQKRPLFCTKHQEETLELFCETSRMLCCGKCVEENTTIPRNNYKSPEEIAVGCRKTLRSCISGLEKKMTHMQGERDRYDRALGLLLEKQNRAEAEIVRCASELISKVEEAKQCCLAELSSIVDEKRAVMVEKKEEMLQHYSRGEHSCMQARSFLALATDTELLCLIDRFQQRLEELTSYDVQCDLENILSLYFHSMEVSVETMKNSLGYLQMGSIIPQDVLAAGDGTTMATVGEEEMVTIATGCDHMSTMIGSICAELLDPVGVASQAAVHDNFNGTYSLYYTPQAAGPHRLSVKICGQYIRGSPYIVQVSSAHKGDSHSQTSTQASTLRPTRGSAGTLRGRTTEVPREGRLRRWSKEDKREAINSITKHLGKPNTRCSVTQRKGQSGGDNKPHTVRGSSSFMSVGDPSVQKYRAGAESLAVVKLKSRSEDNMAMAPQLVKKTDDNSIKGDEDVHEADSVTSSCGSPVKSDSDANNNRAASPWVGPRRKVQLDGAKSLSRQSSPEKNCTKSSKEDCSKDNEDASTSCGKPKLANTFTFRKLYSDIEQGDKKATTTDSCNDELAVGTVPRPRFQLRKPLFPVDSSYNVPASSDPQKPAVVKDIEIGKLKERNTNGDNQPSAGSSTVKKTTEVSNANGNVDDHLEKLEDGEAKPKHVTKQASKKPIRFSVDDVMPKGKLWKNATGELEVVFGKFGTRAGEFTFPIGVAVDSSGGGIIVTDTGNNRVQAFDGQGIFKFMFGHHGNKDGEFLRPSAVVVTPEGDIAVKDDKKIQVFDHKGHFLRRFGDAVLRAPYGLALTKQGHLVTVNAPRYDPAAVLVFTLTGDLVQRSLFEPVQGQPNKLRFLAVSQQNLIVSDLGNDTVYITTLDGKSVVHFGSHGLGDGLLSEPAGVDVDGRGNIILADSRNNRIQVFKPSGDFYCHVNLSEKIVRPSDIALTSDGCLIVVNYVMHTIKKYKLAV